MNEQLEQAHDLFVEKMGFLGTLFGFSKLIGQIYGSLYLSPKPLSLNDLMDILHVSKGSISTNIRELEKWGGCQKVWIKGDRKDFYEAEVNFKKIINKRLLDAVKRRLNTASEISESTKEVIAKSEVNTLTLEEKEYLKFYKQRMAKIDSFKGKLNFLLGTVTKLM